MTKTHTHNMFRALFIIIAVAVFSIGIAAAEENNSDEMTGGEFDELCGFAGGWTNNIEGGKECVDIDDSGNILGTWVSYDGSSEDGADGSLTNLDFGLADGTSVVTDNGGIYNDPISKGITYNKYSKLSR